MRLARYVRGMTVISGIYQDGAVTLDLPVDWPNGTHVEVMLPGVADADAQLELLGDDIPFPSTPEALAELLKRMETIEPLIMSPQEESASEARRQAWREEQKQLT